MNRRQPTTKQNKTIHQTAGAVVVVDAGAAVHRVYVVEDDHPQIHSHHRQCRPKRTAPQTAKMPPNTQYQISHWPSPQTSAAQTHSMPPSAASTSSLEARSYRTSAVERKSTHHRPHLATHYRYCCYCRHYYCWDWRRRPAPGSEREKTHTSAREPSLA